MSRYIYQRVTGAPLLDWRSGFPPWQSRAADAKSLGDWAPIRPGAPEPIGWIPPEQRPLFLTGLLVGVIGTLLAKKILR